MLESAALAQLTVVWSMRMPRCACCDWPAIQPALVTLWSERGSNSGTATLWRQIARHEVRHGFEADQRDTKHFGRQRVAGKIKDQRLSSRCRIRRLQQTNGTLLVGLTHLAGSEYLSVKGLECRRAQ